MATYGNTIKNPDGSIRKQTGFSHDFASGSLTQTFDRKGVTQSTLLDGGAGVVSDGTGISGSLHHQMGVGGAASAKGQIGIVNTPDHQVTAWAQRQRALDRNLTVVGPPTNSVGINYQNSHGAGAFVGSSKTPGFPTVGTVGGNIPLVGGNAGNTQLNLGAQSSFARGMKPNHSVRLNFTGKF